LIIVRFVSWHSRDVTFISIRAAIYIVVHIISTAEAVEKVEVGLALVGAWLAYAAATSFDIVGCLLGWLLIYIGRLAKLHGWRCSRPIFVFLRFVRGLACYCQLGGGCM